LTTFHKWGRGARTRACRVETSLDACFVCDDNSKASIEIVEFKKIGRYEHDALVNWGMLSFGKAELILNMHGKSGQHGVSLWFYTDRVDNLYELLKSRQLEAAQAALAGEPGDCAGIEFVEYLYEPPYGG